MKALLTEQTGSGAPEYMVAVKMAKNDTHSFVMDEIRFEAALMAQFSHTNVQSIIGQVKEDDLFFLVMPFCEFGSLLSWLEKNGQCSGVKTLLHICMDVASGMNYLSSLKIVHRDLAARNVLVSSDLTCKISDFGMSRFDRRLVEASDFDGLVAIRWAAPEAVNYCRFTVKSDIWSFGVLMYEVFTFGKRPYEDWTHDQLLNEVHHGYRLPKPEKCPEAVYQLMLIAWQYDPDQRMLFSDCYESLREIEDAIVGASPSQIKSKIEKLTLHMHFASQTWLTNNATDDYQGLIRDDTNPMSGDYTPVEIPNYSTTNSIYASSSGQEKR